VADKNEETIEIMGVRLVEDLEAEALAELVEMARRPAVETEDADEP